ncbi:MAG: hypothetical protein PHX08_25495 [Lachnospiraceae bacterium]|nr:hypothetical protein [Lachnospiraceae bacterium]
MKLQSGRIYKHDMSDIIGIMKEQIEIAEPINYEKVDKAMNELYNGWDKVPSSSKELLNHYLIEN